MSKFAKSSIASLVKFLATVSLALTVVVLILARHSGPTSPSQIAIEQGKETVGVVQSSGPINLGKLGGGTRELAMVKLPDGAIVSALVAQGGPLSNGDRVALVPSIGPSIGLATTKYEVVGKR